MTLFKEIPDDLSGFCSKHDMTYQYEFVPVVTGKYYRTGGCSECIKEQKISDERKAKQQKKLEAQQRFHDSQLDSGVRKRHMHCTMDNYKTETDKQRIALSAVREYVEGVKNESGACLVMTGGVGTGKTHLASAMIYELIKSDFRCRLTRMSEIVRELKQTWSKDSSKNESQVINYYSSVDFLVVDEIGVQFGSDTERLFISEIIDNRYQDLLPTVLISNLDTDGIKRLIGLRAFDRLRENGGKALAFDWDSQRGAML